MIDFFKMTDIFKFQMPRRFVFGNGAIESISDALGEQTVGLSPTEAAIKSVEGVKKLISDLNLPARLRDIGAVPMSLT
jgi:hypothetical protein